MNVDFQFSSLIGSTYKNGNVLFSVDGNSVLSPVGNKVSLFDLKSDIASTIDVESSFSIKVIALNPTGSHLFVVNEVGDGLYINLRTQTLLFRQRFNSSVGDVQFSPNGRHLAVCREGEVQIFSIADFRTQAFNPFILQKTFKISSESVRHLDWSYDSKLLAAGADDKQVRVVAAGDQYQNLVVYSIASHKGSIVGNYFLNKSFDLVTVDKRGFANIWSCSINSEDIVEGKYIKDMDEKVKKLEYKKSERCNLREQVKQPAIVDLTATAYHPQTSLLIVAFSNGVFCLFEAPTFNLIHNLRVSELKVRSLCINQSGDWLAIACRQGSESQLIVWEWQSETFVMKQQSHSQSVTSVRYSPDAIHLATGAEDGLVKVWSCRSSSCIVTFNEHTCSVSAVCWTPSGKAILSASYDGTVRAHDLVRYRNFRTLLCPEQTQLSCLAVDGGGDLVMAGSHDLFNIFVWSLDNGRLLDVLSGHTAVLASISAHGNSLASVSWDKSLRVWNVAEGSAPEIVTLVDEALAVAYSPCGLIIAVLTLDSTISLFDGTACSSQLGTIDTKLDVDPARSATDLITKANSGKSKSFTCLCFSPDSTLLIAAGQSNYIGIYSVAERMIMKKLKLTTNRSLDGVTPDINRRQFSEFGNMALIDVSDSEEEVDGKKRIKIAGTRHSDLGERSARPVMRVLDLHFSPTGRSFAVCSTEGVAVFSLDHRKMFDPFQLAIDVTPKNVRHALAEGDFSTALCMSLRLNQSNIIEEVVLGTPVAQVEIVARSLSSVYAEKFLKWLSEGSSQLSTRHVHFWQLWLKYLLLEHARYFKDNKAKNLTALNSIQQLISNNITPVAKLCDQNKYTIQYLLAARKIKRSA